MACFYGWGSTASRLQPLRGGSLIFTIQFPEIPGTQVIPKEEVYPSITVIDFYEAYELYKSSRMFSMQNRYWKKRVCDYLVSLSKSKSK